ncbi:hypothetical protein D9613_010740 [Agrocybe pediades]|uniref:Uncharacterized protein n=1 Tax=Agrocybe pediades TaxID=84607 RepID=A0A8H4VJA7_9AGAR|nr:hypothetical protein D9613_010740 [Agrocybe pediades]
MTATRRGRQQRMYHGTALEKDEKEANNTKWGRCASGGEDPVGAGGKGGGGGGEKEGEGGDKEKADEEFKSHPSRRGEWQSKIEQNEVREKSKEKRRAKEERKEEKKEEKVTKEKEKKG